MNKKGLQVEQILQSLRTRYIGKNLIYLKSTDSTNLQASLLGKKGSPEGTLVIADRQTHGKGRLGRSWISPAFANLYFSILLKPPIAPQAAGWISLLAGVSVAEGIRSYTHLSPRIKWPNDIIMNEKKLGGILTELHADGNQIHYLVLGIGINVNMSRFPPMISNIATSLKKELNHPIHREPFLVHLLEKIEEDLESFYHDGAQKIISGWKNLSDTLGRKVKAEQAGQTIVGKAIDLDSHGGLILERDDHSKVTIMAGDVIYLRNME